MATEQALLSGALEVAVRNGDMSFIKYLVMDRRATVDGEPFLFVCFHLFFW